MRYCLYFLLLACLASCSSLKQQRLFVSNGDINAPAFDQHLYKAQDAYKLQKFDRVAIAVFPNKGEQIVDQTGDQLGSGAGGNGGGIVNNQMLNNQSQTIPRNNMEPMNYIIDGGGAVELPMIGRIVIEGYTMAQADSALAHAYQSYVKEPYVVCQYLNKRVFIMGALGDRVITLQNENTSLVELIGMAVGGQGSIQRVGRADRVKIIRGMPGERAVLTVDLTNMQGFNQLQTNIQPNDIVYIEPRRRLDRETLGDISAVFTPILTALSLFTTIFALTRKNN